MEIVFSGAAGSWVFCASAVENNKTKKIGRMVMRRSISGSFIFVKASMNTPAGQFCATVDSSSPCTRLPSAFHHSFDRLTTDHSSSFKSCNIQQERGQTSHVYTRTGLTQSKHFADCHRPSIRVRLSYHANQSVDQGASCSSGAASPATRYSAR